ncbi:MAG: carboxypeptidase regulatory-like domain-containing protein [Nitrospirae bacterium]|nr:carboxypeptidase regulatory-like domain-containing protein [Nitrospirota bacterium]
MNRFGWFLGVMLCVFLFPLTWSWGYTEVSVTNGGQITGTVKLKGLEPPPLAFNLAISSDPAFCGRISTGSGWRLLDQFDVSPEGGLQNVVVMLEGIEQGKPVEMGPATVEAKDCIFSPQVMVVRDQQEVRVMNMDPIIHDVQVYETAPFGSGIMFHRPLRMNPHHSMIEPQNHDHSPGEPMIDTFRFSRGRRIFLIECGFHAYMQTWGVAVNNPYYALTDSEGRFTISDIPKGVYSLVAWHPGVGGILHMQVVVLPNDILKTHFIFDAPPETRNAHTTMVDNPHFSIDAIGREGETPDVVTDHEVQGPMAHH